jgi:tetratricopeptide (TPR) repeat protein
MLHQLFAAMNELLDDIIRYYPKAGKELRRQLNEQVACLRSMSDSMIDEWLHFEEKLAAILPHESTPSVNVAPVPTAAESPAKTAALTELERSDALRKGQGYFKLFMFQQAAVEFEQAVRHLPDSNMARIFLAMTYMHLHEWEEARRHFQFLIALTDHPKWQALGLNALGCIQAIHANLEQAEHYFTRAHEADPSFAGPINNLSTCRNKAGQLTLYFGSGELCCL